MKDVTHKWKNKTRGGHEVKGVWELPFPSRGGKTMVVAHIDGGGAVCFDFLHPNGAFYKDEIETVDLLPRTRKVTKWVNVYISPLGGNPHCSGFLYESKVEGEEAASRETPHIGTYPIEIEVPDND